MKIVWIVVVAMLIGLVIGVATAALRFWGCSWRGEPGSMAGMGPDAASADSGVARAVVDSEEYQFGTQDAGRQGSHEFKFTNAGSGPLVLAVGPSSCRCTMSMLDGNEVAPGKTTRVTLKWDPKDVSGPYRQTATVLTNDPNRPRVTLTISGEITVAIRGDPPQLVFGRVSVGQTAGGEVRLWCNLPGPPLEILGVKLSEPDTARFFEVTHAPIGKQEVEGEKGARSGILLRVTMKPGLPQGPIQQTIVLQTNRESTPVVTVPIRGDVAGDIVVSSPDWDANAGVLSLGTVSGGAGAQRRVLLVTHGPHCRTVRFKPIRIVPEMVQVDVGETTVIGSGVAAHTPLIIQIPKGSRPVNHLGSEQGKLGLILLETNHPATPQLQILLRFAVEG